MIETIVLGSTVRAHKLANLLSIALKPVATAIRAFIQVLIEDQGSQIAVFLSWEGNTADVKVASADVLAAREVVYTLARAAGVGDCFA